MPILDHVLRYSAAGLSVVPAHVADEDGDCSCPRPDCGSPGKHPRLKWQGRTRTSLSAEKLTSWWRRYPTANVGIVTGRISDLVVLDVDGEQGMESLKAAGIDPWEVPTPTVRTGGGGFHFYYSLPDDTIVQTRTGMLPKVDVRAEGGFVIAPPSRHGSGRDYAWVPGLGWDDVPMAPANLDWFTQETRPAPSAEKKDSTAWYEQAWKGVMEGGRNDSATRLAGRYIGYGMPPSEVQVMLEAWNAQNEPPLPTGEIRTIVRSIDARETAKSETVDRAEITKRLSKALGLSLKEVRRVTGETPKYVLVFEEGACELSSSQLLSGTSIQSSIAAATHVVVKRFSTKTIPSLNSVAQWIMDVAEEFDAGEEATSQGEIMGLIDDFLSSERLTPEAKDEDPPAQGCFIAHGKVWFHLHDLRRFASDKWDTKYQFGVLAQKLRSLDMAHQEFRADSGRDITMWGVDEEWVGTG